MRLLFASMDDSVKSVLTALHLTGLSATNFIGDAPIVTLELDDTDIYGNPVELMGDLAIVQHLLQLSPTPPASDCIDLAEWVIYSFSQLASNVTKATCKTDFKFLEALKEVEAKILGEFIGGPAPCTSDLLLFTRLYAVMNGNAWLAKRYPRLASWFTQLQGISESVFANLGEKPSAGKKKKGKSAAGPAEDPSLA
jgi:hypothetical protein